MASLEDGERGAGGTTYRAEMRRLDRAENYADCMLTALAELQALHDQKKSLTDFRLQIGDRTLTAHRCVLKVSSEYFRALLDSGMTEAEAGEVILDHLDFDAVKTAIDYMYGRPIEFDMRDVIPLILVADYFKLDQLKQTLWDMIVDSLDPANCIYWYQVADQYSMDYLKMVAKEAIRIEFSDVAFSEEFLSFPVTSVIDCIQHEIPVNADTALKACVTWIAADVDSRKEHFARITEHIDFSYCSREYIKFALETCKTHSIPSHCVESQLDENAFIDVSAEDHIPEKQSVLMCNGKGEGDEMNQNVYEINMDTLDVYEVFTLPSSCVTVLPAMCGTPRGIFSAGGKPTLDSYTGSVECWLYMKYSREVLPLPSLPVPIYGAGVIHLDNKIYVIGGLHDKVNAIDILDLCSNEWVPGPKMLDQVSYPKVASIGSNIYVLHDSEDGRSLPIQCFDTRANTWAYLTTLPPEIDSTLEASLFSAGDSLYCLGNGCVQYNTVTKSWVDMAQPSKKLSRWFISASPVRLGNRVVICGGARPDWTHTYHPDSDEWTAQSSPHIMEAFTQTFSMAL